MARILIIDDSATELYALRRLLEHHGHEILMAQDAQSGISKACSQRPNLILIDVIMPGMNGFQATRRLNREVKTATIPVIIVTSKDQETDRIWGLRQGACDYLVKPVNEAQLIAKINTHLNA